MTDIPTIPADSGSEPGRSTRHASGIWKPLLAFVLFTIAVTAGGYFVFHRYQEQIRTEKQNELGGIAELKIGQITNWIAERKGDAQALRSDPLFISAAADWLQRGSPAGESRTKLAARLSSTQQSYTAYGYTSIALFDDKAVLRLSTLPDETQIPAMEMAHLLESMRTGQIIFSDIHREKHSAGEMIEIDIAAPLLASKNGKTHTIGAVLLRVAPNRFLFPLIQRWPTPSASAESLLVRRDGDEVVFMNELRFGKNSPLEMRFPLNQNQLPAAMVAMGHEGLAEGVDYRGMPVIAVLGNIAGTSWFMVSKMDKAEIYAPVNRLARWMLLLMLSLIGAGGGIALFWRAKEKKQYEDELDRQRLAKHLHYLSKYANDIIQLVDQQGNIIDFNDRALEAYGYAADEFKNLNISDLRAAGLAIPFADRLAAVNHAESLQFESTHVRRNGEHFPVEVSVRAFNIDGEIFHQAIVRDITERKQAESELARQKNFIRQIIDSDPNLIFVKDAGGRFLLANEAMAKSYGQTTDSIVGKCNAELFHDTVQAATYETANREVLENHRERVAFETGVLADGISHCFQTIRKPLKHDDGSTSVLTIAMDITELKEAELEQQKLNRALRLLSACNSAIVHGAEEEEEEELLTATCKRIVETGGYLMAWVGFAEHGPDKNVRPVARYGSDDDYLDNANISWADTEHGRGPTGIAIRTGVTQVNQNFLVNPLLAPWRDAALARGYQSSIAFPLRSGAQIFGALTIYSAAPNAFNADEVILLQELADNLAWGIAALRTRAERKLAVEKLRESEEHFRFLTENATDMICLMSMPDGRYDYVSPSSSRLTGYTPEEFYDSPRLLQTIMHPDWHGYCAAQWQKFLAGEIPAYLEFQIIHKSGAIRWVHQRNAPLWVREDSKTLIAIQCVVIDITERKLAETRLENERTLLHTLVQTIPDLVWLKDPEGIYLSCNPQLERLYCAAEADIIGKTDYDFADKELADFFRQKDREAMAAGKPSVNEEWVVFPDNGQRALLETVKTPMRDKTGKLLGVMGVARDITGRKQAEEREARLRHILDNTLDMIFIFRPDSLGFVYINKGAINSIGYSQEELLMMTPPDITPLLAEPEFRRLLAPLIAGKNKTLRFESIHRHKNGTDLPVEVQLQLVQEENGENLFVAIVRDITERRQAEKELQKQKEFMWQVIDTDPNQIFVKDDKGIFLLANQSAAAAYGLTPIEMVGKNFSAVNRSPAEVASVLETDRKVIENGREISMIEPYTLLNGQRRWFLTIKKQLVTPSGKLSVLCVAIDITQQKLSVNKLAESYKKLQQLSLHLDNVRAEERARIALNLHDEMGATLAATKMSVAWLASKLPADMSQLSDEVGHLTGLISAAIQTMRQTVTQLNPPLLDDVGLVAAIRDYVKKFQQHAKIECILILPDDELALDASQSATIFRILQESLNNVAKHARASEVQILIKKRSKSLLLTIEDNGVGLAQNAHKKQSFGLLGIRERALMVGGKARIKSRPGNGTQVSVSIPLEPQESFEFE